MSVHKTWTNSESIIFFHQCFKSTHLSPAADGVIRETLTISVFRGRPLFLCKQLESPSAVRPSLRRMAFFHRILLFWYLEHILVTDRNSYVTEVKRDIAIQSILSEIVIFKYTHQVLICNCVKPKLRATFVRSGVVRYLLILNLRKEISISLTAYVHVWFTE